MSQSPNPANLAGFLEDALFRLLLEFEKRQAERFLSDAIINLDNLAKPELNTWIRTLIARANAEAPRSSLTRLLEPLSNNQGITLRQFPTETWDALKAQLKTTLQRLSERLAEARRLQVEMHQRAESAKVPSLPLANETSQSASFPDRFNYHFHGVGQGLFASGTIRRTAEDKPRLFWVYDCGTSSVTDLIDDGIARLNELSGARKRIDLLTLSHFDRDHISGVARLLQKFRIGTLMLPYMPLAQRLVVAFEEENGAPDDPLAVFYVNPVEYFLGLDGPGIERILFVLPSGGDGPAFPVEGPNPTVVGPDVPPILNFDRGRPDSAEEYEFLDQAAQNKRANTLVEFLRPGSAISVQTCLWEFVPYNDDPKFPITEDFIKEVETKRHDLLASSTPGDRRCVMVSLRQAYDIHFGAGAEARNIISLFLYSGPVYPSWSGCALYEPVSMPFRDATIGRARFPVPWDLTSEADRGMRCSILYTGDGYLNSAARLDRLTRYMDTTRIERTGVFQVMHHGAKANWRRGVAAAIAPRFSVFSSDPRRKPLRHPHASVLRDFWPFGAVQVDQENGFEISGQLSRKALASGGAGASGGPTT